MQPTGRHEDIAGFLTQELTIEYTRGDLPGSVFNLLLSIKCQMAQAFS